MKKFEIKFLRNFPLSLSLIDDFHHLVRKIAIRNRFTRKNPFILKLKTLMLTMTRQKKDHDPFSKTFKLLNSAYAREPLRNQSLVIESVTFRKISRYIY